VISTGLKLGGDAEIGAEEACAKLCNLSEQSSCLSRSLERPFPENPRTSDRSRRVRQIRGLIKDASRYEFGLVGNKLGEISDPSSADPETKQRRVGCSKTTPRARSVGSG
jgi:hypothetical protein